MHSGLIPYPDDARLSRGLTRKDAARYVGLSTSAFDQARREGKYPNPTLPGGRYDRILLDQAMNKLSGILTEPDAANPLDTWRASHRASAY